MRATLKSAPQCVTACDSVYNADVFLVIYSFDESHHYDCSIGILDYFQVTTSSRCVNSFNAIDVGNVRRIKRLYGSNITNAWSVGVPDGKSLHHVMKRDPSRRMDRRMQRRMDRCIDRRMD